MPEEQIRKLYYAIGEVAAELELEPHVLRYWETEFGELSPRKNRAGHRAYTQEDLEVVRQIHHLLRVDKYTLEGARQVLARRADGAARAGGELMKMRAFLEDVLRKL